MEENGRTGGETFRLNERRIIDTINPPGGRDKNWSPGRERSWDTLDAGTNARTSVSNDRWIVYTIGEQSVFGSIRGGT